MTEFEMRSLETGVRVPLWVVVMAVRYGLGRKSFLNDDAAAVAREHWDLFPEDTQDQLRREAGGLTGTTARPWLWLVGEQATSHGPGVAYGANNQYLVNDVVGGNPI